MEMHIRSRPDAGIAWATISERFVARLYEQVIKRIINSVRNMKHGGIIILFPPSLIQRITSPNPYVFIKYMFKDEDPVRRLRWLTAGQ
jgi:hypothetical protein